MKALSIARLAAASILSVGLAQGGCAAPGDEGGEAVEVVEDVTDEMWDGRVADAELCVFPYAENVITVEHPQAVGLPWDGALEEGKFYKVVADVTYLNGGVAGYVDYPQVNSVASCEEVAPDELDLPTLEETRYGLVRIGDYAEGELLFHELGIAAVWSDGAWTWRYDGELKLDDGTVALCREGAGEEDVRAGIEEGTLSCADFFVLPAS